MGRPAGALVPVATAVYTNGPPRWGLPLGAAVLVCVAQTGANQALIQFRKVFDDVGVAHAIAQPAQYVIHADARTDNARPPKPDFWVDAD